MRKWLIIKEGERIELLVPHLDGELTFVYPAKGPCTYADVQKQIEADNLSTPTAAETSSLVYAAWQNPDEKYSKEIIQLMKNIYLWAFTGNLYVPNKGVYIQDNPEVKDEKIVMKESDLVKRLEVKDNSVRFVPFGFKTGEQTSLELAKNPYIIALIGEEGAEKLAEVADKYKCKPHVYSFENVTEETTRVTALSSDWFWDGRRLVVDGYCFDDCRGGYALGVRKDAEGVKKISKPKEEEKLIFINPFEVDISELRR